jgi:hypothetical protein
MVDDDADAAEGFPDFFRCLDIQGHVFVVTLRAGEAPVESIKDNHGRDRISQLFLEVSHHGGGVGD